MLDGQDPQRHPGEVVFVPTLDYSFIKDLV
jgi:hypothetical protein